MNDKKICENVTKKFSQIFKDIVEMAEADNNSMSSDTFLFLTYRAFLMAYYTYLCKSKSEKRG